MNTFFQRMLSTTNSGLSGPDSVIQTPRFALMLMIFGTVAIPLIIIGTQGSIGIGAAFFFVLAIVLVTFYRLDWGFILWVGLVLIADNYEIPGFNPLTYTVYYLLTLNVAFKGLGIGVLAPIEVHMLLFLFIFFFVSVLKNSFQKRENPLAYPAILFFGWLIISFLYGKSRGGDMQMGGWEIRALVFFGITFFLVRYVITTKDQVKNLLWVCIATISVKALQAVDRFVSLGFDFGGRRALANHEDPVFAVTLFILLFGLIFFRGYDKQKKVLLYLLPFLLLGFYVANRRATYASFGICLIAFIIILSANERKRLMKGLLIFYIFFSIYLVAYWDSYGRLAVVAQAVKSTMFSHDKEMTRGSDYSSGLARDHENYNLAVTFRNAPIMGIGFGNKHEWAIQAYGEYALKGYITHNQILWLLTKTGSKGFFFFLFFLNLIVMHGAYTFSKLTDPYFKAVCIMCIVAVLNQVVVSFVDMQLTFYRNMVYLGTLTGLISTLGRLDLEQILLRQHTTDTRTS